MSIATSSILHDDPMQRVISALKSRGQTEHKDGLWSCPVCGRAKQLSVGMTDDGSKVMVHCFRKCDTKQILDSVGLKFADLYTNLIWTTDRVNTLLQQEYEVTQKELDSYDAMVASEVLRMHVKEQAKRDYRQFYGSNYIGQKVSATRRAVTAVVAGAAMWYMQDGLEVMLDVGCSQGDAMRDACASGICPALASC